MVKKIQFDANLIGTKLQKWRCNKIARYNKPSSLVGVEGTDFDNRFITVVM